MSTQFILLFRSKRERLHLRADGKAISSTGKARRFPSRISATLMGDDLKRRFPVLRGYKMRVEALPVARFSKNPSAFSRSVESYTAELDRADDLQKSFTGHDSKRVMRVRAKQIRAGFAIGPALGVAYAATRDGKTKNYFHEFSKKSRPLLISDSDGSQLGFVGGRYQFTDRGIEDR